jgi:hypothetical protein
MGSAIIEVGIGMVMVYFILSIIVTQLNNMLVNLTNLRAENLREWFHNVINDDAVRQEILTHPMIGLVKTDTMAESKSILRRLTEVGGRRFLGMIIPSSNEYETKTSDVSNVSSNVFADALTGILVKDQTMLANKSEEEKVQILVYSLKEKVQNTPLEKTLETVIATAKSVNEAQAKLAAWYDSSMGQVSSLFKRRVQFISFVVALLLAVCLNVDSLQLARTLWNDPALRETIANTGTRTAARQQTTDANSQQQATNLQEVLQPLLDLRIPIGWVWERVEAVTPGTNAQLVDATNAQAVALVHSNTRNFGNLIPGNGMSFGQWLGFFLYKVVGCLLTTFAIMQGSDFWFNLLGRLTSARAALTTPTQPPAEGKQV